MEKLFKLFRIQCDDLLVLAEMEYNGMVFDSKAAMEKASSISEELTRINDSILSHFTYSGINISSGKHMSAILYGGDIKETIKVCCGEYKSGEKKGQKKFKNEEITHTFPRLVEPLKKTETANSIKSYESGKTTDATAWSVSEDVLKELKASGIAKKIIADLLEYRRLEKLRGTYLEGWTNLIKEQCWEKDMIHGQLNQCVANTGRLASSKPNLQNADKETKKFLISRYKDDNNKL